ncbi:MAG: TM0106 family RecB-like putative nuclease, partial [Gemmatimonadota bacterium]
EHRGGSSTGGIPPRTKDTKDDELGLAARYGLSHEHAHLDRRKQLHPDLVEIDAHAPDAAANTSAAMTAGRSVIFQGRLEEGQWMGIADFLHRVDTPSGLGAWSYEPWDTKLARSAKPYFLLQLATYAALLDSHQSLRPSRLGFVLGDGAEKHFRTDDFWHYYQRLRRRFERFQGEWDGATMPDPGADRGHGRWSEEAARLLEARDDLSLVAGIARSQIVRLREAGVETLAALATHPVGETPKGLNAASMAKLREQAAMQLQTRQHGEIAWAFREQDPEDPRRGLALLPPPSRLDVFYDIEGFPYAPDGLEYLQGAVVWQDGTLEFVDWWAHDADGERAAFEAFVDWVWARWQDDPTMHVYHYAGYERTALAKLSTKYATREYEVDQFLRHDVLVDLLAVVRQGMVIGTPSYSLKDIEHLYMPTREGDVLSAGASVVEYQRWIDSGESGDWEQSPILNAIRDYNRDDCVSTALLRDWLLERQGEAGTQHLRREDLPEEVADREPTPAEALAQELIARAVTLEGEERRVTELLAWLLEFHRRDDKPMWWRFFDRLTKDEVELHEDADCLAGLVRTSREPWPEKQSFVYEYQFDPEQETKLHEGSKVHVMSGELMKSVIESVDPVLGLLTMKIGKKRTLPDACHLLPDEHVNAHPIPEAIEHYVREWSEGRIASGAVDDLIRRRPPRLRGHASGAVIAGDDDLVSETIAAIRAMDGTTLAIQGPPGTGKTTTAAKVIAALLDDGKQVGIVANGHAVVKNLLAKLAEVAPHHVPLLHKIGGSEAPDGIDHVTDTKLGVSFLGAGAVVLGGTAWLFSRGEMRGTLDYLFIDEAGQVSLANAVGAGQAAENLVLIGDQMQLAQPTQGEHPGESGLSCLEYLLAGHQTIPAELGILLDMSYRMPPDLCQFISAAYYEGRLGSAPNAAANRIEWDGPETGVRFMPVPHDGRTQSSDEECEAIADLVERLIGATATVNGTTGALSLSDILIVAPFNAQVRALRLRLGDQARIGTVDKFQGQEAPVVIVSMCASTLDDAPRGAGFLLSPNRLNVAISRAQALALVVGSPRLGDVRVRSVEEMRLVNGWCRVEGCVG